MSAGYNGLPAYYFESADPITPNLGLSLKGMDPVVALNFVTLDSNSGGSSVKINGSSIMSPNFNNTTPAAPGGNANVTWQVDALGNVSAYVAGVSSIGLKTSSIFIDSTTATVTTNTTAPFLSAGTYIIQMAITDGSGNWSNLVSYTLTADGAHNYNISWNPGTSVWSLGPGTQFSSIFTNNANVFAWVSFNGGPVQQLTNSAGSILYYNYYNPSVFIGNGYTTGSMPIPSNLNTIPQFNTTTGGPVLNIVGAILHSPQMNMINIDSDPVYGNWLIINGSKDQGVFFIDPEGTTGGGFYTERNGVGIGSFYFNAGNTTGLIEFECGNNGSSYTGALKLNLGTSNASPTIATANAGNSTITLPATSGTLALMTDANVSGSVFGWNSDTGISRTAAGVVAIGNGTNGSVTGSLSLAQIVQTFAPSVTNSIGGSFGLTGSSAAITTFAGEFINSKPSTDASGNTTGSIGLAAYANGASANANSRNFGAQFGAYGSVFNAGFYTFGWDENQAGYTAGLVAVTFGQNASTKTVCGYFRDGSTAPVYTFAESSIITLDNGAATSKNLITAKSNGTNVFVVGGTGIVSLPELLFTAASGAPTSAGTAGTAGEIIYYGGLVYFCSVTGAAGSATWNKLSMTSV